MSITQKLNTENPKTHFITRHILKNIHIYEVSKSIGLLIQVDPIKKNDRSAYLIQFTFHTLKML